MQNMKLRKKTSKTQRNWAAPGTLSIVHDVKRAGRHLSLGLQALCCDIEGQCLSSTGYRGMGEKVGMECVMEQSMKQQGVRVLEAELAGEHQEKCEMYSELWG